MRDLNQHPRAVARLRVAAAGAAVGQVDQHLDALQDDLVGTVALDVGHEPDAAGIPLQAGIVQSLPRR